MRDNVDLSLVDRAAGKIVENAADANGRSAADGSGDRQGLALAKDQFTAACEIRNGRCIAKAGEIQSCAGCDAHIRAAGKGAVLRHKISAFNGKTAEILKRKRTVVSVSVKGDGGVGATVDGGDNPLIQRDVHGSCCAKSRGICHRCGDHIVGVEHLAGIHIGFQRAAGIELAHAAGGTGFHSDGDRHGKTVGAAVRGHAAGIDVAQRGATGDDDLAVGSRGDSHRMPGQTAGEEVHIAGAAVLRHVLQCQRVAVCQNGISHAVGELESYAVKGHIRAQQDTACAQVQVTAANGDSLVDDPGCGIAVRVAYIGSALENDGVAVLYGVACHEGTQIAIVSQIMDSGDVLQRDGSALPVVGKNSAALRLKAELCLCAKCLNGAGSGDRLANRNGGPGGPAAILFIRNRKFKEVITCQSGSIVHRDACDKIRAILSGNSRAYGDLGHLDHGEVVGRGVVGVIGFCVGGVKLNGNGIGIVAGGQLNNLLIIKCRVDREIHAAVEPFIEDNRTLAVGESMGKSDLPFFGPADRRCVFCTKAKGNVIVCGKDACFLVVALGGDVGGDIGCYAVKLVGRCGCFLGITGVIRGERMECLQNGSIV